jgi:tetratricopeptide (TPR) repeat protein
LKFNIKESKLLKQRSQKRGPAQAILPKDRGPLPQNPPVNETRRRAMRLVAVLLVPVLLLGTLELGLRIAGYGHSTRLFLPRTIAGQDFLIPNDKFTFRFFPPSLARVPLSMRMAAQKPKGTYRIFMLGESAAYGDPDPSFGMGRYLEALLETRYPATNFEVVNVAITAINSHVILPIARECTRHDGDMWIVYMGNNEMIGPYGAGTVFGERAPSTEFVRAALAVKTTRLGQLMDQLITSLRRGAPTPASWAGIDMFSKNPLRYDDPNRLKAYENFKTNLNDILSVGKKAGIPVILSTVASNLRDCSPFISLHTDGLTQDELADWQRLFKQGAHLETAGQFQSALDVYTKAAAIDPNFAELQFRIGTCHLALHQTLPARDAFERARDHDGLAVRADTRINQIITKAMEGDLLTGVDSVQALVSRTPDGIPGKELFYEHVHLTMAGNELLARTLAEKVAARLPTSVTASAVAQTEGIEAAACARILATTLWDQKRLWDIALGRISAAPFTSQSSHSRNLDYCKARMKEVDSRTTPQSPTRDQAIYHAALARNPDDTLLRWNYAQFFERTGRLSDAVIQGKVICEQLPSASWPHYFVGSLMARQGNKAEAMDYLQRALSITPDFPQARKELAQIQRSRPR